MSHCCMDFMTSGVQFLMNRGIARKRQGRVLLNSSADVAQLLERQDTREMLHATASLVLYMCCLEFRPF